MLVAGHYGLREQNEAGEQLIDFCTRNQLAVMNTFFQNHKRKLYTWTSPNGIHKNQIDFICVCQWWISSIITVKTKPGVDCGTDHELLMCKFKIKLRKKRRQPLAPKFDLTSITQVFWNSLHNRFSVLDTTDKEPEELWMDIRTTVN